MTVKLFGWHFNVRSAKLRHTHRRPVGQCVVCLHSTLHTIKIGSHMNDRANARSLQCHFTTQMLRIFSLCADSWCRIWNCIRFLIVACHWFVVAFYSLVKCARCRPFEHCHCFCNVLTLSSVHVMRSSMCVFDLTLKSICSFAQTYLVSNFDCHCFWFNFCEYISMTETATATAIQIIQNGESFSATSEIRTKTRFDGEW